MNDNEMYEMFKKAQTMINNNQIPDELKTMINNMNSNSNTNNTNNININTNSNSNTGNNNNNSNNNNNNLNMDIETFMKLKNIMSKMNNNDDDMSKLLFALKPYLRNEKKEKVDEYINLIKMGKMTQLFEVLNTTHTTNSNTNINTNTNNINTNNNNNTTTN